MVDGFPNGAEPGAEIQGEHRTQRPLVLGFGNVLLRDDGAGVFLASQLQEEQRQRVQAQPESSFAYADFVDAGTMSFSLLPYIEARDALLIIDAADLGAVAGTVRLLEGAQMDEFLISTRRRTVHEVGITDLLDMARLQGCLPARRALLCIQPGRIEWGEVLSPLVAEAIPAAALAASRLLAQWSVA